MIVGKKKRNITPKKEKRAFITKRSVIKRLRASHKKVRFKRNDCD